MKTVSLCIFEVPTTMISFSRKLQFYYNDSHSVSYIYVGFFLKGSSVALKNDQITKHFFFYSFHGEIQIQIDMVCLPQIDL